MENEKFVDANEEIVEHELGEVEDQVQKAVVLIYSGSTHSFVDPQVKKSCSALIEDLGRPMRIKDANGQYLRCKQKCRNLELKIQDLSFNFNFGFLKVGRCDIVLGIDWVDTVSPVYLHTRSHSISFVYGSEWMTLMSNQEEGSVSNVDTRVISKLISKGQCNFITQMFLMVCAGKCKELIPQTEEKLMGLHEELFQGPKSLPPARECDRAIELLPGPKPNI